MGFLAVLPTLLSFLGPVLEKVIPDEKARAAATTELQRAVINNASSLNQAMADVMKADAASESAWARNARPTTVYWSLAMITWVGVLSPLLGLQVQVVEALKGVPGELYSMVSVGIGAYMLARSADKFISSKS